MNSPSNLLMREIVTILRYPKLRAVAFFIMALVVVFATLYDLQRDRVTHDIPETAVEQNASQDSGGHGTNITLAVVSTVFFLVVSLEGFYTGFVLKREFKPVSDVPRDPSLPRPLDKL